MTRSFRLRSFEMSAAFRRPLRIVSTLGALTEVVAGLIGALTMQLVGPPLAMGLAIWSGRTTEPEMPEADYPWLVHGALLLLALAGHQLGRRRPGPGPEILLHGSAALSVLLPMIALYRMLGRT